MIIKGDNLQPRDLILGGKKNDPGVTITGVQRMGHGLYHVTVDNEESYQRLRAKHITVQGTELSFTEKRKRATVVSVLYYPVEASNSDLAKTLEGFGEIIAMKEMVYKEAPEIKTGTRLFRMYVKNNIPRRIQVNGDTVQVIYTGQPETCNICQSIGHKAERCERAKCTRCLGNGHLAKVCDEDLKCRNCGGSNHVSKDCGSPCPICGKDDHTIEKCRTKPAWKPKPVDEDKPKSDKEEGEILNDEESEPDDDAEDENETEGDLATPLVMDIQEKPTQGAQKNEGYQVDMLAGRMGPEAHEARMAVKRGHDPPTPTREEEKKRLKEEKDKKKAEKAMKTLKKMQKFGI